MVANLAASLEKAATELKKEGHSEGLPDATEIARAVEQALQRQFSKLLLCAGQRVMLETCCYFLYHVSCLYFIIHRS